MKLSRYVGKDIRHNGNHYYTITLIDGKKFPVTFSDDFIESYLHCDFIPENVHLSEDGKRIILTHYMQPSIMKSCTKDILYKRKYRMHGLFYSIYGVSEWQKNKVASFTFMTKNTWKLVYADNFTGTVSLTDAYIARCKHLPNFSLCMKTMSGILIRDAGDVIWVEDTDAFGVDHIRENFTELETEAMTYDFHGENVIVRRREVGDVY